MSGVDSRITEAVEALRGKHRQEVGDVAHATGLSRSKLYRRREEGGWRFHEVAVLAAYYSVPVAVFYDGPLDLSASHVDPAAARACMSKQGRLAADQRIPSQTIYAA